MTTITLPELAEGERYAGIILDAEGTPTHHLILLPGEPDPLNFNDAVKWAASIDGDLPSRQEQSLLFANCKGQFQSDWYWSGEKYAVYKNRAWCQYFGDGDQYDYYTSTKLRARAVRRVQI